MTPGFYTLTAHDGGVVCEAVATQTVVTVEPGVLAPGYPRLVAFAAANQRQRLFLFSQGLRLLRAFDEIWDAGIVPLGASPVVDGTLALFDMFTGRWLTASPFAQDGAPRTGAITAGQHEVSAFERFRPVALAAGLVPAALRDAAQRLDALLALPPGPALIGQAVRRDARLLDTIVHQLTADQVDDLSSRLIAAPAACERLRDLYPADPYGSALPELSAWLSDRDAARPPIQTIGPDLDDLALVPSPFERSLPLTCTNAVRKRVAPRKLLCAVATARNEGPYLLEWIAFHRSLGVTTIFLYTNDNDDGSDALLEPLARAGAIRLIRNETRPGGVVQNKAYAHAYSLLPELLDYRWALTIDLDEYFQFNTDLFASAAEFLHWHEHMAADAIALNWVVFGACGQARWRDEPLVRRFASCTGTVNNPIKSINRPQRFIRAFSHYPIAFRGGPFSYRAEDGRMHEPLNSPSEHWLSRSPTARCGWINHYFGKSTEEYLLKFSRSRGHEALVQAPSTSALSVDFITWFMAHFDAAAEPPAPPLRCAPGFDEELARLLAIPGVTEARGEILRKFISRIEHVVPSFQDSRGILDSGDAGRRLLATLGIEAN